MNMTLDFEKLKDIVFGPGGQTPGGPDQETPMGPSPA